MIDRRVDRTLKSLHQALISLILERGYDTVTIKQIVDRANVGRSTFYTHFNSKDELLEGGLKDLHKSLLQGQKALRAGAAIGPRLGFSRALFEHAAQYQDMFRALVGKHAGAVVLDRMRKLLTDLVKEDLRTAVLAPQLSEIPRTALTHFLAGALMSVLAWWLEEKKSWTPVEVDTMFRKMTVDLIFRE